MSRVLQIVQNDTKSHYRRQINETKRLVNKWGKTGLLEGLNKKYEKHNMAIMLENQARQLIDEISKTGGQNAEEWSSIALPLVRRIFAEIAAKDFVSVQPMTLPSGLVFYMDFKYGTSQPGFTSSEGTTDQDNSIFGVTKTSADASGGLYGSGKFGYTINDYSSSIAPTSGSVTTYAEIDYDATLAASTGSLSKVTVDLTGLSADFTGINAFLVSGSGITTVYNAHTKAVDENGTASTTKITFIVAGTVPTPVTVYYHKQPLDYQRGDFEAQGDPAWSGTNALHIPELQVDYSSIPIVAKTRKLKAIWTPELSQDLNAYHSIDAESELTSMMSEYVSMEIDLEILEMLTVSALTADVWSAKVNTIWNGSAFTTQDADQGSALAYTQPTWFQTLGTKMQKVSNKIHTKTMRGGANFAVTSPDVATVMESMPGFSADTDGTAWGTTSFAMGVQKVGMMNNRYNIYKVPYWNSNVILEGFRGTQFLETGAAYCPYIPLIMTPTVLDPDNLTPRKGVMTRYAKVITRPEFYAKIYVADLNYV